MRNLCLLLVTIFLLCPAINQAQDSIDPPAVSFQMSSFNTAFGMQADFAGEYRVHPDSIEVDLTKADIRISTHCPYKGRRDFAALQFGLAKNVEDDKWDIASASQKFVVERIMSPGEEYSLGSIHFSIPKEPGVDLSERWLVAQLDDITLDTADGKPSRGAAFVQSCKDIFSKPNR